MNEQEQRWIQAARGGDEAAFGELVRLYQKRVYALAVRLCPTPELAEEAAQEAFLAAWQGLPFFRGDAAFSTWLYRLTSNACVDLLRKEQRHQGPSLDDETITAEAADTAPTPEEAAEHRELHQLSYDEIAESLELDLGTVKSRISRGRRQLREFLIKHGNFFDSAASKRTERGL